jgi:hypothetical protein
MMGHGTVALEGPELQPQDLVPRDPDGLDQGAVAGGHQGELVIAEGGLQAQVPAPMGLRLATSRVSRPRSTRTVAW